MRDERRRGRKKNERNVNTGRDRERCDEKGKESLRVERDSIGEAMGGPRCVYVRERQSE